jgi:prefoldin subunit 5
MAAPGDFPQEVTQDQIAALTDRIDQIEQTISDLTKKIQRQQTTLNQGTPSA